MATPIPKNRATFLVREMASVTNGFVVHEGAHATVTSITTDSRAVAPQGAFVALRGASMDGHAFVAAALGSGAAVVVVERSALATVEREVRINNVYDAWKACGVLAVDDTLVAWGQLARAHLEAWRAKDPARRVVAITGSAGKTTTKELTAALLSDVATTHFTAGNLNNRIGLPAVVFGLEDAHRFAVLEMGMSLPGEIDAMAAIARPDVAIVTNVLIAHAEGVGGREGIMHEKAGVYRALGDEGLAVVNVDDPFVVRASRVAKRCVGFGLAPSADYRLTSRVSLGARGSRLTVAHRDAVRSVHLPLPGEASAIDFVAALAAAEAVSSVTFEAERMTRAVSGVRLQGRATALPLGEHGVLLDDTYNANPGSMRAALATLRELAEDRRKVAILGEMKELGEAAREEHVALGDALGDAQIDLAIGCGGLISLSLERAAERGVIVHAADSTEAAAELAARLVGPNDAVLVKASRSVGAEKVVTRLTEVWPLSPNSASSGGQTHEPQRGRGRSS